MAPTQGVSFVTDPAGMRELLESESGPVIRDLMRRGHKVKDRARQLVGVSAPDPVPRKKPHKPGTLRDSIVVRLARVDGDPAVLVGVPDESEAGQYARYHHEGGQPHPIAARRAPLLVFYWPRVGRVVAFPRVNHPGNRPNRFLTNAVRAAED